MTDIYQYLTQDLYVIAQDTSSMDTRASMSVPAGGGSELQSENLVSGEVDGNLSFIGGFIQSKNFVSGTSGWRLSANGTFEAVNAVLSGSINATSGTIGGFTITATALQTAASGDRAVMSSSDKSFAVYDSSGIVARVGINSGFGIQLTPTSVTNNGMSISTSQAGIGINYANSSNVANSGLVISQSSTGASNSNPAINITHAGSGQAILITTSNAAPGIYIGNTGSASSITVSDNGSGTNAGVDITYTRAGRAISIVSTSTSANNVGLYINSDGQGACISLVNNTSSGNPTGIKFNINNSGGNEYAFEFAGAEVVSSAVGGVQDKKVRVNVGGAVYYIPLYDA